jgi:2-dehydro-3-deoxyphosphooctonate aldolase (KDO 8-P synthase)
MSKEIIEQKIINIDHLQVSNNLPFVLFGGINVIESESLALDVAGHYVEICKELSIPYVFKASFDKANRSSIGSFRGLGFDKGLEILTKVKNTFKVPIITDVHNTDQVLEVAKIAEVIQLPAFLSRQTDLIKAMAKTKSVINIKKAQFLAPHEMKHILFKFQEAGNNNLILCERGTCFGYNNLVVDMLGFKTMKELGFPVIFDVTHSLQIPGGSVDSADGRRNQVLYLARAGMSQGLAGLFLEAHPEPIKALCDGPCALPLKQLKPFLEQMKSVDELSKSLPFFGID